MLRFNLIEKEIERMIKKIAYLQNHHSGDSLECLAAIAYLYDLREEWLETARCPSKN